MLNWKEYQTDQKTTYMGENFLRYREYGDSSRECIICLHGIPTWGYIFHDLAEKLSTDYHVLVPDLAGYGFSNKKDNFDRGIDRQAAYLLQWMDELGIEKVTILAHDIGGGVGMRMATSHQDRLTNLILMNSVSFDSWPIELVLQMGHPGMKRFSPKIINGLLKHALKLGFEKAPSKEILEAILAPWQTEEGKISLIRNAASLNTNHTIEISDLLKELSLPTLILWGKNDRFQTVEYAKKLEKTIPQSRLVEVEKAKHWVMLDQPETVYAEVQKFLAEDSRHSAVHSEENVDSYSL